MGCAIPAGRLERVTNLSIWSQGQLSWEDESVTITLLEALDASDVDMFTLVAVDNSETRYIRYYNWQWIYTPRGYKKKL